MFNLRPRKIFALSKAPWALLKEYDQLSVWKDLVDCQSQRGVAIARRYDYLWDIGIFLAPSQRSRNSADLPSAI